MRFKIFAASMIQDLLSLVTGAAILLGSHSAWAGVDPLSHVNKLPPSLETKVQALVTSLKAQGFEVARGYWKTFDVDECKWPIHVIGNCMGNNPTAPYVVPVLPRWRDEYVDRGTGLVFGPVWRDDAVNYRIAEREAIVVLAQLPPPGAYFGLQSYVFSRVGQISPEDDVYRLVEQKMPDMLPILFDQAPDPSRFIAFASIGNSVNNVVIQNQSGGSFGEERFFIITPDAAMKDDMATSLEGLARLGVRADQVFFEPVSPSLVRVGLGREADDLLTLFRYALPAHGYETQGELWRQNLPLAVLRVRDMRTGRAIRPYPIPEYERREAISEQWLYPYLGDLANAVKADLGQPDACVKPFAVTSLDIDLIGQHCLTVRNMNCLGDTQDTDTYRASVPFKIDPPGKVIAVIGSLATATGNATYVSLSVNLAKVLEGVQNLSQEDLLGSASAFGVSNSELLYAVYITRQCAGHAYKGRCVEISEDLVPYGEDIKILQRNYIKPETQRGPDTGTQGAGETLVRPFAIGVDPAACQE